MNLDYYYIPKVEAARQERVLQCLCCYKLDQNIANKRPKRLRVKICSICTGKGYSWNNCEHDNNIEKHFEGNYISTAKSYSERK